ncbi:MAG: sulfite exporter TauE/SafE family protein [Chloroflexi bacterium]|nr:sulfite exporter TauE/SafE family protein [Chloroflexota bacterium]OJV92989.1 MAG: hypothetical protein BGO39_20960 [Chloroflexi bacterium 54-19]
MAIKVKVKVGKRITTGVLLALLVAFWAFPLTAAAHPLGNFTVNRYSRLDIGAAGIKIFYVLDMAEIPTFQEKDFIDLNGDGQLDDQEKTAYAARKATELKGGVKLSLNNKSVDLKLVGQTLEFPPGQGGLSLTRLTAYFETGPLDGLSNPGAADTLFYQDNNYVDRLGWKEIIVKNASGVAIQKSSAPDQDQSNELRTYPQDMLASPLAVTSAQVLFQLDPSVKVDSPAPGLANSLAATPKTNDPFADFINNNEVTLPVLLLSLVGAFFLGIFHALSPGHGKTIVAAYLVGSKGTVRHAALLGLVVTITHTLGVFALGLITLLASQFIVPEKLYPWLGLLSGLIVVSMGITLFRSRLRFVTAVSENSGSVSVGEGKDLDRTHPHPHDHPHPHGHDHIHNHPNVQDHDHDHAYTHHHDHDHPHESARFEIVPAPTAVASTSVKPVAGSSPATGQEEGTSGSPVAGEEVFSRTNPVTPATILKKEGADLSGLSPSSSFATSAPALSEKYPVDGLAHPYAATHSHSHDHNDGHSHSHETDHHHSGSHSHALEGGHSHDSVGHSHSHNGKTHSHLPPGMDGTAITGRKLILFGMSAGLLPCPSALIVMLSAIALNKVAFGILLIIVFSFGLAAAITGIGILLVYARHFLSRLKVKPSGRVLKLLPVGSAFFVAILGVVISFEALMQTGLFNR